MKIKICISSCKQYSEYTIPLLIDTLSDTGINFEDIFVFEGGYNTRQQLTKQYNHFLVPHNSFDYTSLIEIVSNNIASDYWFLLHDTCKVGLKFKEKLLSIPLKNEKYALIPYPSMNIGFYKYSYLQKHKNIILSLTNTDYTDIGIKKAKKRAIYFEDLLFYHINDTNCQYISAERVVSKDKKNWYGAPTPRTESYYPQLDLYTLGANSDWEQLICTL